MDPDNHDNHDDHDNHDNHDDYDDHDDPANPTDTNDPIDPTILEELDNPVKCNNEDEPFKLTAYHIKRAKQIDFVHKTECARIVFCYM